MNLLIQREIFASQYAKAMRIGQRAEAKELHLKMRAVVCAILARQA